MISQLTPKVISRSFYSSTVLQAMSAVHIKGPVPPRRPRRFAPLNPEKRVEPGVPRLQGIIFDVDGTLCEPQNYMFKQMRTEVGIPPGEDILEYIHGLPPTEEAAAFEKIKAIERAAMPSQKAQPGLVQLMDYLATRSMRKGICTRNFDAPVAHLLSTFLAAHTFAPLVTRAFRPPKPDPAGILHIASEWSVSPTPSPQQQPSGRSALPDRPDAPLLPLIMVGDSIDDMVAGRRAGAATVLLGNLENAAVAAHEVTDLVIGSLDELIGVLEDGFEGGGPQKAVEDLAE